MDWFILKHIFSSIFNFITIGRLSDHEKELEILVLRQQLSILQRKLNHPIRPNRVEKMTLAVLTTQFKRITHQTTHQLRAVIRIVQPETVLRWHRELVRGKWTYPNKNKGGRPATSKELVNLVVRLARENPRLGYDKIQGELIKLGFKVSPTSIRNILNRHGILPATVRNGSLGWRHLMNHYKDQIQAFLSGRANPAFGKRVGIRCPDGSVDDMHAFTPENSIKGLAERTVIIMDQEP